MRMKKMLVKGISFVILKKKKKKKKRKTGPIYTGSDFSSRTNSNFPFSVTGIDI